MHFAVLQNTQKAANTKISRQVSQYTTKLRKDLSKITDYTEEYEKIFGGDYVDKKLPKDDLFYSIKDDIESKVTVDKKQRKKNGKNPDANILPTVHPTKLDQLQADQDKLEKELILHDMKVNKDQYPDSTKHGEGTSLVKQLENQSFKMAFQGDFEKLDEEIKVQLKALQKNDMETFRKIRAQEMNTFEIERYIMSDKDKAQRAKEKEGEYDSDLDRTLYQEYWSDLREIHKKEKKPNTMRNSKSVMRGQGGPAFQLGMGTQSALTLDNSSMMAGAYGSTPKGISGSMGGLMSQPIPIEAFKPQFNKNIKDPFSPLNREINHSMNDGGQMKQFDSIFEEYIEKRKKFDGAKKAQANAGDEGGDDAKKNEVEVLKNKIEMIQKNQVIEMRHSKETSAINANDLLEKKLAECKFAYEEELESISLQFENLQEDVRILKEDKIDLKRKLSKMEDIIIEQQNMIETTGFYINKKGQSTVPKTSVEKQNIKKVTDALHKDGLPMKAKRLFETNSKLLTQPFSFYSFGVKINEENSDDILSQVYPRQLEAQIMDIILEKEIALNELQSVRKMTKTFKQTEEQSNKKIYELKMKYEMAKDEKAIAAEGFDKRLNQLIRDFVKLYRKLGDEFIKYKSYVQKEIDIQNLIIQGKDKEIAQQGTEIGEFRLCLKIPRQHYKYIEKLRFDELIIQREEIRQRYKKKYGIDPAVQVVAMPDPSLPPEQQLENLGGGQLASKQASGVQSPVGIGIPGLNRQGSSKGLLGSPGIQKDYSVFSLASKTTKDTNFKSDFGEHSMVMSPSIRFGLHKSKKSINVQSTKNPFQSPEPGSPSPQTEKN